MRNTHIYFLLLFSIFTFGCRMADSLIPNTSPIADAGVDQNISTGAKVNLDGSKSTDADKDPLVYNWLIASKPVSSKAMLSSMDSIKPTFVADASGTYKLKLIVSDGIESDMDSVFIYAVSANMQPIANAGADQSVDLGAKVNLSGAGSSDPENATLIYSWTLNSKPFGSQATLSTETTVNAGIVTDIAGTYIIKLLISDGVLFAEDVVNIYTNPAVISGINPTSGASGTTVNITGKNFSKNIAENVVKFNGVTSVIQTVTYTKLTVVAPLGAGTGIVAVTTGGNSVNGPVFTYLPLASTLTKAASPYMMAKDASGNLYVTGYTTHVVYKITSTGTVTTYAGTGVAGYLDGKTSTAQFKNPAGIAIDIAGNIYVADYGNHCIRKINTSAVVSTYAGFPQAGYLDAVGGQAQFNGPTGLTIDATDNLYVVDGLNHRIRKINTQTVVTTIAGNGKPGFLDATGILAQFSTPIGIAIDAVNNLYIADAGNNRIRKITPQLVVTTVAGTGTPGFLDGNVTSANFNSPNGITVGSLGRLYVSDTNNNRIRKIDGTQVTTYAGNGTKADVDGLSTVASFSSPTFILYDATNTIFYLADYGNDKIKKITIE